MVAPTILAITPMEGLSLGSTFVEIDGSNFNDEASGGTLNVYFGGVLSPEFGVVSDTKVIALTPPGAPGVVDVTVENVPAVGPAEPTTIVSGFEYKRPSIATRPDLSTHSTINLIDRALVADMRRTVIENVWTDMHPEYVDTLGATEEQEAQATSPSLKLLGPDIAEDRFHSINGRFNVLTASGFTVHDNPVTVQLTYTYVGVGRTAGETKNLWQALTKYFNVTQYLKVFANGVDDTDGEVEFEMSVVWTDRGEFREQTSREGVYQFTGSFVIRGVHVVGDLIGKGDDVNNVTVEIDPQ